MDVLISLTVVIISQCIHVPNYQHCTPLVYTIFICQLYHNRAGKNKINIKEDLEK